MQKQSKRILVTGLSGLIGKELIEPLLKENYEIFAVSRTEQKSPWPVHWIVGDIFDSAFVRHACETAKAEYLINMAWIVTKDYAFSDLNFSFLSAGINLIQEFKKKRRKKSVLCRLLLRIQRQRHTDCGTGRTGARQKPLCLLQNKTLRNCPQILRTKSNLIRLRTDFQHIRTQRRRKTPFKPNYLRLSDRHSGCHKIRAALQRLYVFQRCRPSHCPSFIGKKRRHIQHLFGNSRDNQRVCPDSCETIRQKRPAGFQRRFRKSGSL